MKDIQYHLSVKGCRAIKSAEIDLSKVTVLTGVNASGKSTIARLFRDIVELSAEYERLLAVRIWNGRLGAWHFALSFGPRGGFRNIEGDLLRGRNIHSGLANGAISLFVAIELLEHALCDIMLRSKPNSLMVRRIKRSLDLQADNVDLLSRFRADAKKSIDKFKRWKKFRTYEVCKDLIHGSALEDGHISFDEDGRVLFSNDSVRGTLGDISSVKRAIYIKCPFKSMPVSVSAAELDMGDAFVRIRKADASTSEMELPELYEILAGEVDFDETKECQALLGLAGPWVYHRTDGKNFDLDDCATGIKALSILSVLHSKGWLDAETLLIIDEPEAHLHPQWIVEYARILLLLVKRIRVRIVMTSHSLEMVNAIHTIGTALGIGDSIGFYLAEEDKNEKFLFNYRSLGNKVGDIFKAYNVSFDRIDEYARNELSK